MPRSSSRRSAPARRSAPPPRRSAPPPKQPPSRNYSAPPARPPPPAPSAPAQQSSGGGGGMMSGLMGTMAQGMAFGTGSSIAHGVVGSLMGRGGGSNQQQQQEQQQAPTSYDSPASAMMFEGKPINEVSAQEVDWMDVPYQCQADKQSLYDCLSQVNENVKCQRLFASLKACKDNNY